MRIPGLRAGWVAALLIVCSVGSCAGEERTTTAQRSGAATEKIGSPDQRPATRSEAVAAFPIHSAHIFDGAINRRGDLVGLHHRPSAPKQMRVEGTLCDVEFKQTSPGGDKEVVTARVMLRDPSSGRIVREKFSTLFPAAWSKTEIEQAIRDAYADAKAHGGLDRTGGFHGRARGVRIDGYLTADHNAIATAFPVLPRASNRPRTPRSRQ